MPNPFVKGGAANTSKDAPTDRTPLTPQEEFYEGQNLPYRGVMYHGVEPTLKESPTVGYDTSAVEVYEEYPVEQEPVPVRVVNQAGRFQRLARADTRTVITTDEAFEIAGREDTRISLRITNLDDANAVFVGFGPNMERWTGSYQLAAGQEVPLTTKEPVWILGTADTIVTWIAEYEVPVDDD